MKPILLACLVGMLAGCQQTEPYQRVDVWRPTGANAGNLAAMVADPHDLIRGHGEQRPGFHPVDARAAAGAVALVAQDHAKPLQPAGNSAGPTAAPAGGQN